jgi:hypothetical protein
MNDESLEIIHEKLDLIFRNVTLRTSDPKIMEDYFKLETRVIKLKKLEFMKSRMVDDTDTK